MVFFLTRNLPYKDRIFDTGIYGSEETRILSYFTPWIFWQNKLADVDCRSKITEVKLWKN